MSNGTKILRYDLGEDLTKLLDRLDVLFIQMDKLRGDRGEMDLSILLQDIDINMFSDKEKEVIKDLIDTYAVEKKHVSIRLKSLEQADVDFEKLLKTLEDTIEANTIDIKASIKSIGIEERDQEEEFTYDTYGNIFTQTVKVPSLTTPGTLEVLYVETYYYTDQEQGKMSYSDKVFKNEEGKTVTLRKTYTYTGDDITKIKTQTTVSA